MSAFSVGQCPVRSLPVRSLRDCYKRISDVEAEREGEQLRGQKECYITVAYQQSLQTLFKNTQRTCILTTQGGGL